MPFREGDHLIEEGVGVAHGAARLAGDPEQGLGLGGDAEVGRGGRQKPDDHVGRDQAEGELLAAALYRRRHLVLLGRGEHEDHVGGRLLDRLQQGVEGARREHVDFVDDVDLVAAGVGRKEHLVLDLAHVLDRSVGGAVDLDHIEGRARGDGLAGIANSAGFGRRSLFAVQRLGEDARRAGLAAAPGAGKQISVRDPAGLERLLERRGDKLLSRQLFKGLRAFSGGGDFIRHGIKIAWRRRRVKHLKRKKPGALRHRTFRVPLLPSGPGGFRSGYEHSAWLLALQTLRRDRDSNPRYPYEYTRLPIAHLRPLGHLSKKPENCRFFDAGAAKERGSRRGGDSNPRNP